MCGVYFYIIYFYGKLVGGIYFASHFYIHRRNIIEGRVETCDCKRIIRRIGSLDRLVFFYTYGFFLHNFHALFHYLLNVLRKCRLYVLRMFHGDVYRSLFANQNFGGIYSGSNLDLRLCCQNRREKYRYYNK